MCWCCRSFLTVLHLCMAWDPRQGFWASGLGLLPCFFWDSALVFLGFCLVFFGILPWFFWVGSLVPRLASLLLHMFGYIILCGVLFFSVAITPPPLQNRGSVWVPSSQVQTSSLFFKMLGELLANAMLSQGGLTLSQLILGSRTYQVDLGHQPQLTA